LIYAGEEMIGAPMKREAKAKRAVRPGFTRRAVQRNLIVGEPATSNGEDLDESEERAGGREARRRSNARREKDDDGACECSHECLRRSDACLTDTCTTASRHRKAPTLARIIQ
jgi:hypothetical protein